jgi:hypothetical protein
MVSLALATPVIGANVNRVTAGTTTNGENAEFQLGTRVIGPDGNEYVYCQAGAALTTAITSPNAVAIDEDFQASLMTTALALDNWELGFAPIGTGIALIPDNSFFWARVNGATFNARVSASAAADTYLRTTITAGRLGTASTASAVVFYGVVLVTAASASTSAGNSVREVLMTKGRAIRQGNTNFVN